MAAGGLSKEEAKMQAVMGADYDPSIHREFGLISIVDRVAGHIIGKDKYNQTRMERQYNVIIHVLPNDEDVHKSAYIYGLTKQCVDDCINDIKDRVKNKKKGLKQHAAATSKPGSLASPVAPPVSYSRYIYIDDTSLYSAAQSGPQGPLRLDAVALGRLLENGGRGGEVIQRHVAGNVPHKDDHVWRDYRVKRNFNVLHEEADSQGRTGECFVTNVLYEVASMDINEHARGAIALTRGVLVLASGSSSSLGGSAAGTAGGWPGRDKTFSDLIQLAVRAGWAVELWGFRHSRNPVFVQLQQSFPEAINFHDLDEHAKKISKKAKRPPKPTKSAEPSPSASQVSGAFGSINIAEPQPQQLQQRRDQPHAQQYYQLQRQGHAGGIQAEGVPGQHVGSSHEQDRQRREQSDPDAPESNRLYLANLSFDVTEQDVRGEFGRFGKIKEVSLPTDRETGRLRGIAFVTFNSIKDAVEAERGLHWSSEPAGADRSASQLPAAFGTIPFKGAQPQLRQQQEQHHAQQHQRQQQQGRGDLGGHAGDVAGGSRGGGDQYSSDAPESNRLYLANLSFDVTEQDVRGEFERFGEIKDVDLLVDRVTGRLRGIAFVTFNSIKDAVKAERGLHCCNFMGRKLRVSFARSKDRGRGGPDAVAPVEMQAQPPPPPCKICKSLRRACSEHA